MPRILVGVVVLVSLAAFIGTSEGADKKKKKAKTRNQMVKGTIKSVDINKLELIVNQQVGKEKVQRELSIDEDVDIIIGDKEYSGKQGLIALADHIGAAVQVKCDKDVKVLKVTVKGKKKKK